MPALDEFQEYVSVEENRENHQYRSADREYDCFFVGNRLEKEKGQGTADDIYYIESVKEGDQDQESNTFEIIDDKNREHDI